MTKHTNNHPKCTCPSPCDGKSAKPQCPVHGCGKAAPKVSFSQFISSPGDQK